MARPRPTIRGNSWHAPMSAPERPTRTKKERHLGRGCQQSDVAPDREHRPRAAADAVHRGDNRLAQRAQIRHHGPRHPCECQQSGRVAREELADDLLHVAAGAEAAPRSCDHHDARALARFERRDEVAQLGVGLEGERVQLLRAVERDRADAVRLGEPEMLGIHRFGAPRLAARPHFDPFVPAAPLPGPVVSLTFRYV